MMMNKLRATSLSLLALMALPSISQAGEDIVVTAVTVNPVSYAALPPAQCPWWMEAAAFYGFSSKKLFKRSSSADAGHVDSYGGDLTLGYNFDTTPSGSIQAWDLRLGYGYGSNSTSDGFTDSSGDTYKERARVHRFTLMPGYRYTTQFDESWSGFFGVNLGIANMSVKSEAVNSSDRLHSHKSDWGFAYSAELGLKWQFSQDWYAILAYQFQGSTNSPTLHADGERMSVRPQTYNTIRLGLGWNF